MYSPLERTSKGAPQPLVAEVLILCGCGGVGGWRGGGV